MEDMLNFSNNLKCLKISKDFLISLNTSVNENNSTTHLSNLKLLEYKNLVEELCNDNRKKTFWINIYNSFIKLRLKDIEYVKLYPKSEFFSNKDIEIANMAFSFDDIEHKILRKSQIKLMRGYMSNFDCCLPKWEKELRVNERDYRVHFALNCGAKGCPPIRAYDEEKIEEQLDIAKKSFINTDSYYNKDENTLMISKIFYWFLGDFGGEKTVKNIHKEVGFIPHGIPNKSIKIIFKEYNWDILDSNIEI